MTRHIVPIGGAGLDDPALTVFVLGLARAVRPKVCFIGTASGDSADYLARFHDAYPSTVCDTSHLDLFHRRVIDVGAFLREQDVVFVGGGNTVNLLAIWRAHGVDRAIRRAYEGGTVLTGSSAGCICWFEASITDSYGLDLAPLRDGLGILAGSCCPHYDSEARRRPVYTAAVAGGFPAGYALEDAVALHFADERLVEAVSARPGSRAYRVEPGVERPLETRAL